MSKYFKNIFTMFAIFSFLCLFIYTMTYPNEEKPQQEVLCVGLQSGGYPPFVFMDEEGSIVGFDVDVVQLIAEKLGKTLSVKQMEFDGFILSLKHKKVDLIMSGMNITPTRLKEIQMVSYHGEAATSLSLKPEEEDVHTAVENVLDQKLGVLGKKLHTARSRNDQVLLDIRLYSKDWIIKIIQETLNACKALSRFADEFKEIPIPGRTHFQRAMPSSLGLWSAAFSELFATDKVLSLVKQGKPFREAYKEVALDPGSVMSQDPVKNILSKTHIGATGNLGLMDIGLKIQEYSHWLDAWRIKHTKTKEHLCLPLTT